MTEQDRGSHADRVHVVITAPPAKWKRPDWLRLHMLPTLVVDGRALSEPEAEGLIAALSDTKLAEPPAFVAQLRGATEPDALADWSWKLFEQWIIGDAPTRAGWALTSVGLLGNDTVVLELARLIRNWPGLSFHKRAVRGLECLQAIGTKTALLEINDIAQRSKYRGLRCAAEIALACIALMRGLTIDELGDELVPTHGLETLAGRTFDYGLRSFTLVFGDNFKLKVRDEKDKIRVSPPKPGVRDDAEIAPASLKRWRALKKQVTAIVKLQTVRLEAAMVDGRRWEPGVFREFLLDHPIMRWLTGRLVWGSYTDAGPNDLFMVDADDRLLDHRGDEVDLPPDIGIGIVHPLDMDADLRGIFRDRLSGLGLEQPFPQFDREVNRLTEWELGSADLQWYAGRKIPSARLISRLNRARWRRGPAEDAGFTRLFVKPFTARDVTAVIEYPGVPIVDFVDWDDQVVERCGFVHGIWDPRQFEDRPDGVPLGAVDPVAVSEVLRDLGGLFAGSDETV